MVCNLCAVQGHKSADCPNKDKCHRCGASGHFARDCANTWGKGAAGVTNLPRERTTGVSDPAPEYTFLASITDSLPMEFYVTIWDTLGSDLVEVLNASLDHGSLSSSQRIPLIFLIYKKGDRLLN